MDDRKIIRLGRIQLASCFSIQAIGVGIYISYGVFFNSLEAEFGWSRAALSGASSLSFFISGLFGIYIGRLNDNIGPRIIMTVTSIFCGMGYILLSGIETLLGLYLLFGVVFGIGFSSVDVVALTTIARWFPGKRGVMTGIAKVGTGAGQFLFPIFASWLILGFGWRNAYIILGAFAGSLLILIAQLLIKDPVIYLSRQANKKACKPNCQGGDLSFFQAAKTIQLWTICIVYMIVVFCLMSTLVHIVAHGKDLGISTYLAAGLLSIIGGVSMLSRFLTGLVIDRLGSKQSMLVVLIILVTSFLWLQAANNLWMLYIFAAIYGIAHGGIFTVISPIVAESFGISSHGSIFGMVLFFGTSGGALGAILTGYLFDISGSYDLAFKLLLLAAIIGLGIGFLLKSGKIFLQKF